MEPEIIDFVCPKCGHSKAYKKEDISMIYSECVNCGEITLIKSYNKAPYQPLPECPTCHSINIERISSFSKVAGAAMFGIFSNNAKSQFRCKNCGYKW